MHIVGLRPVHFCPTGSLALRRKPPTPFSKTPEHRSCTLPCPRVAILATFLSRSWSHSFRRLATGPPPDDRFHPTGPGWSITYNHEPCYLLFMPKEMDDQERRAYGRRLRAARMKAGLSQREVAERIGGTQPFISRAEAGEMMLRAIDYPPVAELLGVDVLELIGPLTEEEQTEIGARRAALAEANRRDGFAGGI